MIYDAECRACGRIYEYTRPIDERNNVPPCPGCGGADVVKVILSAPSGFVRGKFDAFRSTVDGTVIRSQRELEEHNKRNRVVNLHDGFTEDKILSGDFGTKKAVPDKKEVAATVVESIKAVESGYKPKVQSDD